MKWARMSTKRQLDEGIPGYRREAGSQSGHYTAHRHDRGVITEVDIRQLVDFHFPLNGPEPDLQTRMHVTCALLCWFAFLRFDDLARVLVHYDLLHITPGVGAEIILWKSKTDQRGEGQTASVGFRGDHYCPMTRLEELLTKGQYVRLPKQEAVEGRYVSVEDVGPLLRRVTTSQTGVPSLVQRTAPLSAPIPPLPYRTFLGHLRRLFVEAGLSPRFGTHSLRSGGVTAAVNNGADRSLVQKLGRWKSADVFEQHYVKDSDAARGRVTALSINTAQ
ncbi:hypothetical protein VOLCADRAFT_101243 [Volvox carteri f. nagariensis]|uniref:Tyr recombinase domain-containing protein n=1 Tax=Volvox carteri f. nagariensis TaxID=3068 RepID=D8UM41_VOLCA|nr:uncharacterized protein VOLCADRAFT_101243 [Volvox carteri f. nagariensis]EFJ39208.1 hypothetical protein VOLCADRAFT_101243 [Volvox carteri f. nagariensis]|eukprot:XP_002959728.1 hypothetical protein VOLCADRAFT_101243 [Volvox carteri f. nagariensis]